MLAFIIPQLGFPEIMMIMLLALLLFGPKKIPEIGRMLGKGLREFKRSTSGFMDSINQDINTMDQQPPAQNTLPKPLPASQKTETETKQEKASQSEDKTEENVEDAELVIDLESEEKPAK